MKKRTKEQNVNELAQLANSAELFEKTIKMSTAPENMEVVTRVIELMISKGAIKVLQDRIAAIYDAFYNDEEAAGILKYYKSKVGKKTLESLPMITVESARISKAWMDEFMAINQDEILAKTKDETSETRDMLIRRGLFVAQYMQEKGWGNDIQALTLSQINEIRAQDGWINAERNG